MSMPKGYKKENGYGTAKSLGGLSYHQIAESMRENNFKMNHSTARNVFVNSLIKIARQLSALYNQELNYNDIKKIAIDPRFQEAVADYMRDIEYEERSKT
jgi:hypothetical protein